MIGSIAVVNPHNQVRILLRGCGRLMRGSLLLLLLLNMLLCRCHVLYLSLVENEWLL